MSFLIVLQAFHMAMMMTNIWKDNHFKVYRTFYKGIFVTYIISAVKK